MTKKIKNQIVRRTYSIYNGKPSSLVRYIMIPKNVIGSEIEHADLSRAYVFKNDEAKTLGFNNICYARHDYFAHFTYKQEVIDSEPVITSN